MISKYQLIRNIDESLTVKEQAKVININFDKNNLADFLTRYPYYKAWLYKHGYLLATIGNQMFISRK